MQHFTVNSINKEWFKGVSLKEFMQAHAETGVPKSELHDAYAQLKAITEPQQPIENEPKANVKPVEEVGPTKPSGDNADK